MAIAERPVAVGEGRPAGIAGRLAANVLDGLVAFILVCVLAAAGGLLVLAASGMGERDPSDRAIYAALVLAGAALPLSIVLVVGGWGWRGRSIGKLALNLRLVNRHGRPPGLARALLRWLVLLAEVAPPVALGGLVALIWVAPSARPDPRVPWVLALLCVLPAVSLALLIRDPARRSLHDRLAGTRVIVDTEP